jgi:hypothetical protein
VIDSRRMTNMNPMTDGEFARCTTPSVRRALSVQTGCTFPVDAEVGTGDDVEFASPRHPDTLRRGRVLGTFDKTFLVAEHRSPENFGRQLTYRPVMSDLRRVYRDGEEVARLPWLRDEDAVPLPEGAPAPVALARAVVVSGPLPSTAAFVYRPGDEVAYEGRGDGVYRGVVNLVIPAHDSYEQEVHVRRNGYVSAPRLVRIRRVWREGVLVAVRPGVVNS